MGKHCTGVHIMICDENLVHEIRLGDRDLNHFKMRKLTVGPDILDLIKLEN